MKVEFSNGFVFIEGDGYRMTQAIIALNTIYSVTDGDDGGFEVKYGEVVKKSPEKYFLHIMYSKSFDTKGEIRGASVQFFDTYNEVKRALNLIKDTLKEKGK